MDPRTGEFHELDETIKGMAVEQYKAKPIFPKAGDPPQLHPSHRELVVKATGKRVPKDWPIFTVGETYNLFDRQLEVAQITSKDLHLRGDIKGIERGALCELQDRSFRVRFTRGHFVVLRPVIGRLAPT